MLVKVGVSNRHVHLNEEDFNLLFSSSNFDKRNDLTQEGEFASLKTVTIKGPKGSIDNVRVVGPLRNYTQVEVLKSDTYILGVNPPVRTSGDLFDASVITLKTDLNEITRKCCIIADRHIHISKEERKKYNLTKDKYKVKINTDKGGIIDNVYIKESDKFNLELHLDRDDANAFLLKDNDLEENINLDFVNVGDKKTLKNLYYINSNDIEDFISYSPKSKRLFCVHSLFYIAALTKRLNLCERRTQLCQIAK